MAAPSVRDRLLRIATQLFAAEGFEATTMRAVASRAGVTLPTLYHYFGDKQNLYVEACLATFGPRAERAMRVYAASDAPVEHKVMGFFVDLAAVLLEDENYFKLMHREIIDQDREGIRRLAQSCWKQPFTALCQAFRTLLPDGRAPEPVVFASLALVFGLVEFRRIAPFIHDGLPPHYTPQRLAQLALQTALPGVQWAEVAAHLPASTSR